MLPPVAILWLFIWATGSDGFSWTLQNLQSQTDSFARWDGDVYLGGLFPIHQRNSTTGECSPLISAEGLMAMEAFNFSVDMVNSDHNLMPNITLGGISLDTCGSEKLATIQTLRLIWPGNETDIMLGVVGPMFSSISIQVANLLGLFKTPQISYAATSPSLSSNDKFPYFLRTVPSDVYQAQSLLNILERFHWRLIIGVYEDSNYGTRGFSELEKLIAKKPGSICFADKIRVVTEDLRTQHDHFYLDTIEKMSRLNASAVVLYVHMESALRFFNAANQLNLQNRFVWVGTDGWGSRNLPEGSGLEAVVEGAIVTNPAKAEVPGFCEHFHRSYESPKHRWLADFKSQTDQTVNDTVDSRSCNKWREMSNKKLRSHIETEFGYAHFVRKAVLAFAHAFTQLQLKTCHRQSEGLCEALRANMSAKDDSFGESLLQQLKNVSFDGGSKRPFHFVNGKDGLPVYSVLNYQNVSGKFQWVEIGQVTGDCSPEESNAHPMVYEEIESPKFKQSAKDYPISDCGYECELGERRVYDKDICCWHCLPCAFPQYLVDNITCRHCENRTSMPNPYRNACIAAPEAQLGFDDPYVLLILTVSSVGFLLTSLSIVTFFVYWDTPVIKAAGRELSFILLCGIFLCYAVTIVIVIRPTEISCGAIRVLYNLSYAVCYSAIFTKSNRLTRIFQSRGSGGTPKKMKYISPFSQILIVTLLVGFQLILNGVWLWLKTPEVVERSVIDQERQTVVVIRFCAAFHQYNMAVGFVYPVFLFLLSTFYAFKTRKIPGSFNETRYILITNYSTCVLWIAFIPIFFSAQEIRFRLIALSAVISLNGTVILACMFAPKLYIALLRPHKNTRENVMGRVKSYSSLQSKSSPSMYCQINSENLLCIMDEQRCPAVTNNNNCEEQTDGSGKEEEEIEPLRLVYRQSSMGMCRLDGPDVKRKVSFCDSTKLSVTGE